METVSPTSSGLHVNLFLYNASDSKLRAWAFYRQDLVLLRSICDVYIGA